MASVIVERSICKTKDVSAFVRGKIGWTEERATPSWKSRRYLDFHDPLCQKYTLSTSIPLKPFLPTSTNDAKSMWMSRVIEFKRQGRIDEPRCNKLLGNLTSVHNNM